MEFEDVIALAMGGPDLVSVYSTDFGDITIRVEGQGECKLDVPASVRAALVSEAKQRELRDHMGGAMRHHEWLHG